MKRMLVLWLAGLSLLILAAGCEFDRDREKAAEAQAAEAEQRAKAQARIAGEALAAAREGVFKPDPAERALLEAGTAINPLGTPNGYFTNPEGVSGYFTNYERPFNFTWNGGTVEKRAFDGRTYRIMDGPGELALKYVDDPLILQRYKGDMTGGLWNGHGEHWTRNAGAGGHHYMFYQGDFRLDHMNGQGVLINYNFGGPGGVPVKYEGELRGDEFHGQGLFTNLATEEVIYKGLWFEGCAFTGSRGQWLAEDDGGELREVNRQFADPLMTDRLEFSGFINPDPGRGPLTIVLPRDVERAVITDQTGRVYPIEKVAHPTLRGPGDLEIFVPGARQEPPLADYPLTLNFSYDRGGLHHFLRLIVKHPFGLVVEAMAAEEEDEADEDLPGRMTKEELKASIDRRLRELEKLEREKERDAN